MCLQTERPHMVLLICKAVGKSHPQKSIHQGGNLFFFFLHFLSDIHLRIKILLALTLTYWFQEEAVTLCGSCRQPDDVPGIGEPLGLPCRLSSSQLVPMDTSLT